MQCLLFEGKDLISSLIEDIKKRFTLKAKEIEYLRKSVMRLRNTDLKQRKALTNTEKKPLLTANFEGLVDIVNWEGKPTFWANEKGKLSILS